MGGRIEYKEGEKIGRCWFVVDVITSKPIRRAVFKCECGKEFEADISQVKRQATQSCGCWGEKTRIEIGRRNKTHGQSMEGSPLYGEYCVWSAIYQRCTNPNARSYPRYGGRGINMSHRWANSFEAFMKDMGPRPSILHSIDRKDNDKGYYKSNCYWATDEEQANNKRNNVRLECNGLTMTLAQWAKKTGLDEGCISRRIFARGWSVDRALNTPTKNRLFVPQIYFALIFNGTKKTFDEWAKITKIPSRLIKKRLTRGWDVRSALSTPVQRKGQTKNASTTGINYSFGFIN